MQQEKHVGEFDIISGTRNIILVAPHGVPGDDDNTAELTRLLAEKLGCHAVINEVYQKPSIENGGKHDITKKIVNLGNG